jgi:hypothetical protein
MPDPRRRPDRAQLVVDLPNLALYPPDRRGFRMPAESEVGLALVAYGAKPRLMVKNSD